VWMRIRLHHKPEVSIEPIPHTNIYGIECYNYSSSADSATPRHWLHHINAPCIEHGAIENRVWMYWQWRWVCILITRYKQQGQKQWNLQPWGILVRKTGLLSRSTIVKTSHWNATLLPITLSPGLACLLGTYGIQIWSKLGNRLSLWRPLQCLNIVGHKWVTMHPHAV